VDINGVTYHYGRESEFGQYLVESAEYAKDYWCFDTRDDLLAFLVNLPESADRDWLVRRHPDWSDVTHEERTAMLREHRAHLRSLMAEKLADGRANWINVLALDEAGHYSVNAPAAARNVCDDVRVVVCEREVRPGRPEPVIELRPLPRFGDEERDLLRVGRQQALKLAAALIRAALDIEFRTAAGHFGTEP
jgi:hypothetical protein